MLSKTSNMTLLSLAALALAIAPATATADRRVELEPGVAGPQIGAGPVFSGGSLTWTASVPRGRRLFTAIPGSRPRTLQLVPGSATSFDGEYSTGATVDRLTASPGHMAYVLAGFSDVKGKIEGNSRTGESIWLANAGRTPTSLLGCPTDVASASVALDGTLLASTGCADNPVVTLRDLAAPGVAPRALAASGTDVRIAGPYVAWRTPEAIVVYDRDAGSEAYRVELIHAALPGPVIAYDLQRDGKLAIGMSDPRNYSVSQLAWTARDAPTPRVVPPLRGRLLSLRAASDRVAVQTIGAGAQSDLRLVDLGGSARTVARIEPAGGGIDFDGTRLAWAGRACSAPILHVRDVTEPGVTEDRTTHCPAEVSGRTLRVDRRGRVAVDLFCPAPAPARRGDACAGRLLVRTLAGRRVAQRRFKLPAGEFKSPEIRLPSRVLKGRPPRRIRVVVVSSTRGHVSRTHRAFRLRVR